MKNISLRNSLSSICAALAVAMVTAFLAPRTASAQVLYGQVVGHVTDPSGAAVPEAKVRITNQGTSLTRDVVTDSTGYYSVTDIVPGTYSVQVVHQGFKTFERKNVSVPINAVTRVDVALEVGAVSQEVTVTATAALLQTDTPEVHADVGTTEVENLPVPLGRNYQQLYRALPGFTPPANSHSIPTNPARALVFNVNGTSNNQNNTRIDGVSTYNIQLPHVNSYVPTLESIETVNVVTDSFDAEQGFAGGAAINVQTKSGTNQFHASLFEYHSDQHIKAWPMLFQNAPNNVGNKPKFIDNDFGGSAGGPIKKNKLFYFASYEGIYQRQTAQRTITIPTAAMRAGDLRSSSRAVFDPTTGDPATASGRKQFVASPVSTDPNYNPVCSSAAGCPNVIPLNRLDPIAQKILSFVPPTNRLGDTNNLFVSGPFKFNRNQVDGKINFFATSKLTFTGTFGMVRYDDIAPTVFGDAAIGRLIGPGGNPGHGHGTTYRTTIMGTYTFSPNFLMDAHFGWAKQGTNSEQQDLGKNIGTDVLGIPGTNGTRAFESSWPQFDTSGFATIGITNNFMPYYRHDPQYQYEANFNWIKRSHNIRFGTDLYRQALNQTQAEFITSGTVYGAQGGFHFNRAVTQSCLTVSSSGSCSKTSSSSRNNAIGSFLLGLPDIRSRTLQVPDVYHIHAWLLSFYARDRWNLNPRLTLDYGLRWEYYPVPKRPDRGIEFYDSSTNTVKLCGTASIPKDCGVQISKKLFAPRVGFAYRATDTFVVRAGYGITIDPFEGMELLRANYPLLVALTQHNSLGDFFPVGPLAKGIPAIAVPNTSSGSVPLPLDAGWQGLPKKFDRGYVQSWNVSLQRQFKGGFTGQVGYVATRTIRELGYLDINAGQIVGAGDKGRPLFAPFGRTESTTLLNPVGTGTYDSLQAQLQRRFTGGLAMTVNYTWGKAINNIDNSDDSPGDDKIQVFRFMNLNRSATSFDRTHNLEIMNVWQLPFGKNRHWLSNQGRPVTALVSGWQLNSLVSAITGRPFTVYASGSGFNTPGSNQTADQVLSSVKKIGSVDPNLPYYDPNAFADVEGARFGTSGFNILRGPRIFNWDFGLFREFSISEQKKLRFSVESFNFTNTPHLSNPDNDVSDGVPGPPDFGSFMTVTGKINLAREGIDERQVRFGLRLIF